MVTLSAKPNLAGQSLRILTQHQRQEHVMVENLSRTNQADIMRLSADRDREGYARRHPFVGSCVPVGQWMVGRIWING